MRRFLHRHPQHRGGDLGGRGAFVAADEQLLQLALQFHLAARRFGRAPETMLFIDDNAANIATARSLGWHVHHFVGDPDVLEQRMRALGLL